jgi:lysophospholipase L1-like esterase
MLEIMNASIRIIAAVVLMPTAVVFAAETTAPTECVVRDGLPNFFAKLHRGEAVRIAYLGGSITDAQGWRVMTGQWLQQRYPESEVIAHNASHSGTGSDLACFRMKRDCLPFDPDLLFIEFGVNDGIATTERIHRGIEGIIRQARRANPRVDICLVYALADGWLKALQQGKMPHTFRAMDDVADHYGLPSVHLGLEVVRKVSEGTVIYSAKTPLSVAEQGGRLLFSRDGVHPLKQGHALYRDALARAMEKMEYAGKEGPVPLPDPFRADNYEDARPTALDRVELSPEWRKLDPASHPLAREFRDKLPQLWCAEEPGATISVRFKGTGIMLYDVVGPDCGQIIVTVDEQEPKTIPRFDPWTQRHRVYYLIAATDLEDTEHRVRFEIHPEQPDKAGILSQRGAAMDDPARYDGTTWYVGDVLVTGEVLAAE